MASVDQKPGSPAAAASTSASQRADESDLDPAAFLKSVRELSEKREREDAERYRQLEEDIARGRQERAARRAERAKSISPVKAPRTPSRTDTLSTTTRLTEPPPLTTPASAPSTMDPSTSPPAVQDVPDFRGFGSGSKLKHSASATQYSAPAQDSSTSSTLPARSASSLARSGTLSWQQRPRSRGGDGSRPDSMVSTSSSTRLEHASTADAEPSRDQIAASLGARDPSWFKQTADRGVGNAAYRKSKDESTPGESFVSGRRGLPGMSREISADSVTAASPAPSESVRSGTTSRTGSIHESTLSSSQFSTDRTSTSSKPDLKSLIAADQEQEKAAPMSEQTPSNTDGEQSGLGRTLTMSSSQARIANSTDRSPSPTKGMGGFVQSAMMKRSDSLNKRWSAQPPSSSISRQNSTASARSGYGGLTGSHSMPKLEPTPASRESSKEPNSRPTSSSSNLANMTTTQQQGSKDVFVKPALPSHSRSKSVASTAEDGHTSPPASPSKRWSPTKSTWLESAITRPDSPKPAAAARNSQPAWMTDIAKAKAQRASVEITPKPAEDESERPVSPTKAPFGQGMLKRSESRDLDTHKIGTPKLTEDSNSRPASPTKMSISQGSKKLETQSSPVEPVKPMEVLSTTKTQPSADIKTESKVPETSSSRPQNAQPPSSGTTKDTEDITRTSKTINKPSVQPKVASDTKLAKPKPETPPKPQTDFRSTLRSRAPPETKQQDTPEFLSKFGSLKKTQTQNYVAPDILKGNILRGKSELAKTGRPVKTERRDELKESLLAKKDQWKKDKEEGIVHERKISNPPQTPQKPEALAKRELLGRSESIKSAASPEKPRDATPEALARHKSLKEKPKPDAPLPFLQKQKSEPLEASDASAAMQFKQPPETSKLASRFNPALAGVLARGPPGASSSNPASRSGSPAHAEASRGPLFNPPSEAPVAGAQLQDMRKGRAKGPKRRKGGAKDVESEPAATPELESEQDKAVTEAPATAGRNIEPSDAGESIESTPKPKPQALPGSAASIMMASLKKAPSNESKTSLPAKSPSISSPKPSTDTPKVPPVESKLSLPAKSPSILGPKLSTDLSKVPSNDSKPSIPAKSPSVSSSKPSANTLSTPAQSKPVETPQPQNDIPEFKGFGSIKKRTPAVSQLEDNKENAGEGSPSIKSAISAWGRQTPSKQNAPPSQIQLPSRKDEEAAMRSAGLLASSPSRPSSSNGLGIKTDSAVGNTSKPSTLSNVPPKPSKPSRSISGQLQEASPNKSLSGSQHQPLSDIEQRLADVFGSVPKCPAPLSIDTHAVIATPCHQERVFRTMRKTVQVVSSDGSCKLLQSTEEYTFFEEDVYICTHAYSVGNSPRKTEIFVWIGESSTSTAADSAQADAKKIAKENGNAYVHTIRQGLEPPGFLQALGGILVTRQGSRDRASKQYMLRGRQYLGQIVFDEVAFGVESLCSGFAYLISFPVTLQETKLYLWKGRASSTEEVSGGRLTAMGSIDGVDVIEVDDGAEFASFLKTFGPGTTKASIPKPTHLWQQKSLAASKFSTRLFRIQQAEARAGLFTNMFNRRPSWGSKSPARKLEEEFKADAIEISPFSQIDLEADCIYVLDAYAELYVLVGPMFPSQPEIARDGILGQTILFASEYALTATSDEDRQAVPKASILLSGVPNDLKMIFRHWDEGTGLWGTGGLMAGSQSHLHDDVEVLDLNEVLDAVCRE